MGVGPRQVYALSGFQGNELAALTWTRDARPARAFLVKVRGGGCRIFDLCTGNSHNMFTRIELSSLPPCPKASLQNIPGNPTLTISKALKRLFPADTSPRPKPLGPTS